MNNIQKAFKTKNKCGLRMATGGLITNDTDSTLGGTPDSTSVVGDLQKRVDFMKSSNADYRRPLLRSSQRSSHKWLYQVLSRLARTTLSNR